MFISGLTGRRAGAALSSDEAFGILGDPFILYVILVLLAPLIFYEVGVILAPRRPSRVKKMAFESGQAPLPWRVAPFPIEYFPYVVIYIAYALLAVIAFFSVLPLIGTSEGALRLVVVLGVIAASSVYLSSQLRRLVQRV